MGSMRMVSWRGRIWLISRGLNRRKSRHLSSRRPCRKVSSLPMMRKKLLHHSLHLSQNLKSEKLRFKNTLQELKQNWKIRRSHRSAGSSSIFLKMRTLARGLNTALASLEPKSMSLQPTLRTDWSLWPPTSRCLWTRLLSTRQRKTQAQISSATVTCKMSYAI